MIFADRLSEIQQVTFLTQRHQDTPQSSL